MWANAQRDGRPAEYRWRPPFNAAKFGWHPLLLPCSNAAKTRNQLKFAGVPQTGQPISAASRPKFTILWGHVMTHVKVIHRVKNRKWRTYCCLTSFFRLSIRALIAKIWPDKFVRWCPDGDFWRLFCVLCFQRAACSRFQTCVLNSY